MADWLKDLQDLADDLDREFGDAPTSRLRLVEQIHATRDRARRLRVELESGVESGSFSDLSTPELIEALRAPGTIVGNVREIRLRRFSVIEGGADAA